MRTQTVMWNYNKAYCKQT